MKLTDLNPRWVSHGGEGITRNGQPVPYRERVAVSFDCPCGCGIRACIPLSNPPDGQGKIPTDHDTWEHSGDIFESLTLSPSIQRHDCCRWHGYVTNGEIIPC